MEAMKLRPRRDLEREVPSSPTPALESPTPDRELPGGPGAGRRRAFREEALVHLDDLYGLALRFTGGAEDRAEDLVQTTLMKAYRAWESYEPGTNCRAWLMTILRNAFLTRYRRRKRAPGEVEFEDVEERGSAPELHVDDPESIFFHHRVDSEVVEAIEELPERFRLPLVLADLQDLSYDEIAGQLEVPVGTVKSRLHRARRRLRGELLDYAREMGYVA